MTVKKSLSKSFNYSQNLLGWFLIALFFCYQYLLRVTPGVLSGELRTAFMLTAEDFAALGAYYLYAYALMQMPLGFIVDRIGVKRTVLISLSLCILGTLWLTQSSSIFEAKCSRVLVGAGSACAFMSALKWASDHFQESKRAFLMGATLTLGTLGALSAAYPLVYAVDNYGWKNAVVLSGFVGIGLFTVVLFFLKDSKSHGHTHKTKQPSAPKHDVWGALKSIATSKTILIYSFLTVGVYIPLAVLADLWGVAFLIEKFELGRADAASTNMLMYAGLAIGCLFLPTIAQRFNMFTRAIQVCSAILLVIFLMILALPWIPMYALMVMYLLIGILCGAEMICFTGVVSQSTPQTSGLLIGFVNTLNMGGGAILQQIIGTSLDMQWNGVVNDAGVRVYSADQYAIALSVLPIVLLGCVFASFYLKQSDFSAGSKTH